MLCGPILQSFKEDISLSDDEVALIGRWVDAGAPEGDKADLPPARTFAGEEAWTLGKPDLIVSSPKVLVKGVGSDWWGPVGESPIGITESRYARAAEVKERSDLKPGAIRATAPTTAGAYAGQGKTALVVFHHANINVVAQPGQQFGDGEGGGAGGESDPMYDQPVEIVIKTRRPSISLVQRHLRIGYNRAARLIEQMERSGLVSAMGANGNREVLVPESAASAGER